MFSTLSKAVSGVIASQTGLRVTGHNLSNVNTKGFSRQQSLQHDSPYVKTGTAGSLGLGVTVSEIRQIRDNFADARVRVEGSILSYHSVRQQAANEVEAILGEPDGECISNMMDSLWKNVNRLSNNPAGLEERLSFIQSANTLIKKANHVMDSLVDYQNNLNTQVKQSVDTINNLIEGINELNNKIVRYEVNGDNANDLRDQRNLMLDELSSYASISYKEETDGRLTVKIEGRAVVDSGMTTKLSYESPGNGNPFVTPVWEDTRQEVFRFNNEISLSNGNDGGSLKALLVARGNDVADYTTDWDDIAINDRLSVDVGGNAYTIPKKQKELSLFINEMTKMINNSLNGFGTGSSSGISGTPVFTPIKSIDGTQLPEYPDRANYNSDAEYSVALEGYKTKIEKHLTPGNIQVNPELLKDDGYSKLGTIARPGDTSDNSILNNFLKVWDEPREFPNNLIGKPSEPTIKFLNFNSYYNEFVSDIGREGYDAANKVKEQNVIVTNIENKRLAMGSVSQDEELANMMTYQYAYNASARMITVLDSMLEHIITRL